VAKSFAYSHVNSSRQSVKSGVIIFQSPGVQWKSLSSSSSSSMGLPFIAFHIQLLVDIFMGLIQIAFDWKRVATAATCGQSELGVSTLDSTGFSGASVTLKMRLKLHCFDMTPKRNATATATDSILQRGEGLLSLRRRNCLCQPSMYHMPHGACRLPLASCQLSTVAVTRHGGCS